MLGCADRRPHSTCQACGCDAGVRACVHCSAAATAAGAGPEPARCAQGWLDTTYLSSDGEFRISKGNKGTVFVLVREQTPKDVRPAPLHAQRPGNAPVARQPLQLQLGHPVPLPCPCCARGLALSGSSGPCLTEMPVAGPLPDAWQHVQAVLAAVAAKAPDAEIKALIQKLRDAEPGIPKPAQSSAYSGSWELLWDYSVCACRGADAGGPGS